MDEKQQEKAMRIIRGVLHSQRWLAHGIDGEATECVFCGRYYGAGTIDHSDKCPVQLATELLREIDPEAIELPENPQFGQFRS